MTYDSLDIIPYKLFLKIASTGDFKLLSDTETNKTVLEEIWQKLFEEHQEYESSPESNREFSITMEIECLETEYKFIHGACYCLKFDLDEELLEMIREKRYTIRTDSTENYYEDIEKVERFSEGLRLKIKTLKDSMPKESETEKSNHEKITIDDVMAAYTMITGYDFDFNNVTYTKFKAIQRQVNLKMKSIVDQQAKMRINKK